MITPIILVGMNRSGTKWVSNILCSHQDVAGVQSERARGILETNMFGAMQDKFDLSYPDEYVGFLELWAKTEFFRRTETEKDMFYRLTPRPRNFLEMFDLLMREFARKNGKTFWLQKTSPLRALDVLRYFKGARIVVVRRNLIDTLRSTWGLQSRYGKRRIIRSTYAYIRQRKILDRIVGEFSVVEIDYDLLRSQTSNEINRLYTELGLDPQKTTAVASFSRNSSFASDNDRNRIMSPMERLFVTFVAAAISIIPLDILAIAATVKARLFVRKPIPLMPGSFGSMVDQLEDRSRGTESI